MNERFNAYLYNVILFEKVPHQTLTWDENHPNSLFFSRSRLSVLKRNATFEKKIPKLLFPGKSYVQFVAVQLIATCCSEKLICV